MEWSRKVLELCPAMISLPCMLTTTVQLECEIHEGKGFILFIALSLCLEQCLVYEKSSNICEIYLDEWMSVFNPHCTLQGSHEHSSFTNPETEAQRGQVTGPRSQSWWAGSFRVTVPSSFHFTQGTMRSSDNAQSASCGLGVQYMIKIT